MNKERSKAFLSIGDYYRNYGVRARELKNQGKKVIAYLWAPHKNLWANIGLKII